MIEEKGPAASRRSGGVRAPRDHRRELQPRPLVRPRARLRHVDRRLDVHPRPDRGRHRRGVTELPGDALETLPAQTARRGESVDSRRWRPVRACPPACSAASSSSSSWTRWPCWAERAAAGVHGRRLRGRRSGSRVMLGLANALVWPLLLRIALPFTVATLGFGALVLNALLLLWRRRRSTTSHVNDFWSRAGRRARPDRDHDDRRRRARARPRRPLVPPHRPPPAQARQAGDRHRRARACFCLEIDGLAHDVLRRAMRDGNAPALARWVHDDGYRLERWETDWSSQTGACQAGLLHGDDDDMPAFRWWEKDLGRAIVTNHPRDAAEIERRHSDGRGLLYADGASRANILSGDAPHSMLTMSTVLDRDRPGRLGQDYFAYFASPYGVARTMLRVIGEVAIERFAAIQQGRRDVRPRIKRGWDVRARARLRDGDPARPAGRGGDRRRARRAAGRLHDVPRLRRGRPSLGRRAPGHARGAAPRRPRDRPDRRRGPARPAAVPLVVLSDHGQSQGATFLQRYGETLEDVVHRHGGGDVRAEDAQQRRGPRLVQRRA